VFIKKKIENLKNSLEYDAFEQKEQNKIDGERTKRGDFVRD